MNTDDLLIVDAVVHALNLTPENVVAGPSPEALLSGIYGLHEMLSPTGARYRLNKQQMLRDWSAEELERLLFLESDVDAAIYHSLPLTDFFNDGLVSLDKGIELRRRNPDRVQLYAAVNPLEEDVLDKVEYLVKEIGVLGLKIYPARLVNGETVPVRLDDPNAGKRVVERAVDLGVRCIGVHKYFPIGPTRLSAYHPEDVEIAGLYPEINFEVLHPGFAFLDETCWLLARYPNVYVNLEWSLSLMFQSPRRFAEVLGNLLKWGGEDRILWASGACLVHPQAVLEAFLEFSIPEDLVAGYGFPPLTPQIKRKILGENYCRLHNLDPVALKRGASQDRRRREGRRPPFSGIRRG